MWETIRRAVETPPWKNLVGWGQLQVIDPLTAASGNSKESSFGRSYTTVSSRNEKKLHATLPLEPPNLVCKHYIRGSHWRRAEVLNSLPTKQIHRILRNHSESLSSAWTLNSYAISKHSASNAFTLPWPSGMSEPTKNLPSMRILSIEFNYVNQPRSLLGFPQLTAWKRHTFML